MRNKLILASLLWCVITPAMAQVSIGIRSANVSIGINLPVYPQLVRVPGYPVYYAPDLRSNYFFYDGYYWVYQDDIWYQSDWYNGPWYEVDPFYVPEFVLRIPVRYYRLPPRYFLSWQRDAAPRWDEHWGRGWSQRRSGWDRWDRKSVPAPAPLPVYQRQYSGDRYPARVEQQRELQTKNYKYQPRTPVARQPQEQPAQRAPLTGRAAPEPSRNDADVRSNRRPEPAQAPQQREAPVRDNNRQQPAPQAQPRAQRPQPDQSPREAAPQRNDNAPQPNRKQSAEEDKGRNKDDGRDERNDRGNRDKDRDR